MSPEDLKAKNDRIYQEVWNNQNLNILDEFLAPECTLHGTQSLTKGLAAYRQLMEAVLAVFPDIHYTVHDFIVGGDKTVTRWTFRATHKGTWFGVPATDQIVNVTGVTIFRVNAEGKGLEEWICSDVQGVLLRLDAMSTETAT